jgi:uncharacterized protein (DUF302 family)
LSLKLLSLGDGLGEVNRARQSPFFGENQLSLVNTIPWQIIPPRPPVLLCIYKMHLQAAGPPCSVVLEEESMSPNSGNGIVSQPSAHSVDVTVEKLQTMLQGKGVTLFAVIDHSGEARRVGLAMPPTKLLVFGNPKGGTPLMLASPSIAIDLPLKILVAQGADGKVSISYNAPEYLQTRHNLPAELLPNIAIVGALVTKAAQ